MLSAPREETLFWENKAHMHRRFADPGVPTPHTVIVNAENCKEVNFDVEPVVVKQEHSAGSAGIRYFSTGHEARRFVMSYPFRPTESLIVQEVVAGATRDLRLTMAGAHSIPGASYWREKSAAAVASPTWTPTATKYGSTVNHGDIPESAVLSDCRVLTTARPPYGGTGPDLGGRRPHPRSD